MTYREADRERVKELEVARERERAADVAAIAEMKRLVPRPLSSFGCLRAVVAFVVTSAVSVVPLYWIAMSVSPPQTPEGYGLMPIGQVAFALVFAPILGAIVGYVLGRKRGTLDDVT